MPNDITGWLHTLAAVIALITGTIVLTKVKGTRLHKRIGRFYGTSMLIVCATSFMIFKVQGSFGVLHFFATLSTITLIFGMFPLYSDFLKNPIVTHLSWMYWSVIGLYCAFAAEIFTRLPMLFNLKNSYGIFYTLVGISTGLVGFAGSYHFRRKKSDWEKRFSHKS